MTTPTQFTPAPAAVAARSPLTAPGNVADRAVKRQRVLDILDAAGRDSLLLTSNTALTWYLDGSRVHISLAGDPIAALLVDRSGDHLVTFNNEAGRIAAEELPGRRQPGHRSLEWPVACLRGRAGRWRRPVG